jgi:hypothetical protein
LIVAYLINSLLSTPVIPILSAGQYVKIMCFVPMTLNRRELYTTCKNYVFGPYDVQ